MPHSFELPRMWSAVIKLVRRKWFAGFGGGVINKLVAFAHGHTFRRHDRRTRWRSGLQPRLATVVRSLNDLPEPAAGLRRENAVRIHGRAFDVINLPAGEMRTTNVPLFTFPI